MCFYEISYVLPAADEHEVDCVQTLARRWVDHRAIQLRQEAEDKLYALIAQRFLAVLQLAVLDVGEQQLQNALHDVAALGFALFELRHRGYGSPLLFAQDAQIFTEHAGELGEHTVFYVAVLEHVCDILRDMHQRVHVLRVCVYEIPKRLFASYVLHARELWLFRVPDMGREVVAVSLRGQEVREQAVTQLVGEQPRDYLVALNAGTVLRDHLVAGVDAYCEVVRAGGLTAFWRPV